MPTGYVRQDTTGQLADGNPIDADLFNDEYNACLLYTSPSPRD